MPSIPLHCNICPKQPDFSDISHLLTNISSKGHLSHYHKAQVRGRQDASVRQQLDIYNRWYIENQIEKLLSQRMILKDSKRPNGITRPKTKSNSNENKPTKPAAKASSVPTVAMAVPVVHKTISEPAIDPQLSRTPLMQTRLLDSNVPLPSKTPPDTDLASIHRAHIPRMRAFSVVSPHSTQRPSAPNATAALQPEREDIYGELVLGDETEDEDERNPLGKKNARLYPEPPMIESLQSQVPQEPSLSPIRRRRFRSGRVRAEQVEMSDSEKEFAPQTPELKGVYYPGMSIFDSASPEAQRRRNQRKHTSILAQIEQDSLEVECFEYIYWPDGSLKLARFITGDVQSSPLKEDTPPPPKRQRGKGNKTCGKGPKPRKSKAKNVLGSSPNVGKFPDVCEPRCSDLQDLWKRSIPMLDSSFLASDQNEHHYDPGGANDWLLNMGDPRPLRHHTFPVPENASSEKTEDPMKSASNSFEMDFWYHQQNHGLPFSDRQPCHGPPFIERSQRRGRDSSDRVVELSSKNQQRPRLELSTSGSTTSTAAESMEPELNTFELWNDAVEHNTPTIDARRVNQQYFFYDNPSEYYTFMPPQMAFGALAMPSEYITALNPLNPNALPCRPLPLRGNIPHGHTTGTHGPPTKADGKEVPPQGAAIEE